jgi:predicted DNA-binding transcriptional regulator AlpA
VLVDPERLMGRSEIRKRLGVGITRVKQIISRDDFPRPLRRLDGGHIWDGDQVEAWIAEHRPPPDEPETLAR